MQLTRRSSEAREESCSLSLCRKWRRQAPGINSWSHVQVSLGIAKAKVWIFELAPLTGHNAMPAHDVSNEIDS